jgi:hypothetical protein
VTLSASATSPRGRRSSCLTAAVDAAAELVGAQVAVNQYTSDADSPGRFEEFQVTEVSTDGVTVTVTFHTTLRMPFGNLISARYAAGHPARPSRGPAPC